MPRTRSTTAAASSGLSARITPRLPDNDVAFTTHGRPTAWAAAAASSPGPTRRWGGCTSPAPAMATRMVALSLVAATAAGGLWRRPRRSAAVAAATTPCSSTATMPATGERRWSASIASAAAAGSASGTTRARSPIARAMACACSEPTTTSTSSAAAAATKSGAR